MAINVAYSGAILGNCVKKSLTRQNIMGGRRVVWCPVDSRDIGFPPPSPHSIFPSIMNVIIAYFNFTIQLHASHHHSVLTEEGFNGVFLGLSDPLSTQVTEEHIQRQYISPSH